MIWISIFLFLSAGLFCIGITRVPRAQLRWKRYIQLFVSNPSQNAKPQQRHHTAAIAHVFFSISFWALSLQTQRPLVFAVSVVIMLLPWAIYRRNQQRHHIQMNEQMDSMLANLANAVTVTGNLFNAIEDVAQGEAEPMRSALEYAIHEIKLGKTEEEALQRFAKRSQIPLLNTAITAVIVGKQSGGNLGTILSSTAAGIREIKRLEGVLKVKTAEGRNQAWVMGMMPMFLCGILQIVSPNWLIPIWTTPVGWGILFVCIVMEGCAIILIRKILAVTL